MVRCSIVVAAALLIQSTAARALDYIAPSTCPDQSAFLTELRARAPKAEPTTLSVELTNTGAEINGTLTLRSNGAPDTIRKISGTTCDEVVRALALIAALTLNEAPTDPVPVPVPDPISDPPRREPLTLIGPVSIEPTRRAARWSTGAALGFTTGALPGLSISIPIYAELALPQATLRATILWSAARKALPAIGTANFNLLTARLEACPFAFETQALKATPCALAEAGAITGTGDGVANASTEAGAWAALGVSARVRWRALDRLYLELSGAARAPLIRESFAFRPDTTVYRVAAIAADGALGAGLEF